MAVSSLKSRLAAYDWCQPWFMQTDQVSKWLSNHGCYTGVKELPMAPYSDPLTDPLCTPFERLYVVDHPGHPFLAMRLRPNAVRDGRLHDSAEILVRHNNMKDAVNGLVVYTLAHTPTPDDVPEPMCEVDEAAMLAEFDSEREVHRWV